MSGSRCGLWRYSEKNAGLNFLEGSLSQLLGSLVPIPDGLCFEKQTLERGAEHFYAARHGPRVA
jgi:hypothetical protein